MLSEGQGGNLKSGLCPGFTPILLVRKGETRVLKCSAPEDGQAGLGPLRLPHSPAERTCCGAASFPWAFPSPPTQYRLRLPGGAEGPRLASRRTELRVLPNQ